MDSIKDVIDSGLDIDDLLSQKLEKTIDLPCYFAYIYIFYAFLPKTRFYYLVNDNESYNKNKPEDIDEELLQK